MARTKALLGAGARLSDHLSASLLARVYPAHLITQLLNAHGVNSQRNRSLPAVATAYYCMALSLYPEAAYEEVFAVVAQGLSRSLGTPAISTVAKSSISAARTKLGWAPLKDLHERACAPLADPQRQPHAFYAGLRLVAWDGSNFEIPDEAANLAAYGRPGSPKPSAPAGYPQARCAILVECATHAILAASLGPYARSEQALVQELLARMDAGMLCLADQGFRGYAMWQAATATGAQLLWRCVIAHYLPIDRMLPDGSYLSQIYPDTTARRRGKGGTVVRVVEYDLPGLGGTQERYRLVTTLLDHTQAPALELAQLYHERWEVEAVFDELKTHLKFTKRTLRSKTPDGVHQEFYGWILAHYAVCWLMHETASKYRFEQRKLSFTKHLHLLRRQQPPSGAFPPSETQTAQALV